MIKYFKCACLLVGVISTATAMDESIVNRSLLKGTVVEIKSEEYNDDTKRQQLAENLKNNENVVELTIHVRDNENQDSLGMMKDKYQNFRVIIQEGLQNKPKLKKLTFVGNLAIEDFLLKKYTYTWQYSSDEIKTLNHLKFIGNLEYLIVQGVFIPVSIFEKLKNGLFNKDNALCLKEIRYYNEEWRREYAGFIGGLTRSETGENVWYSSK